MSVPQTIRTANLGKRELRLVRKGDRFFGLAGGKICAEGDDADVVWTALQHEAGKSNPSYFGYQGARARFLQFFPDGFRDSAYDWRERDYKLAAKKKLDESVPLEKAVDGSGFGEAILGVYRATNLLSPFEKTRLQDILRAPEADDFIRVAAEFAMEGSKSALTRMSTILAPWDCAKWTVVTYLPYLWRPEEHMFLKPRVTREFAARVGHPFADQYEAKIDIETYLSLLDLVEKTRAQVSDLRPRDNIDLQSFIWIVGEYQEVQAR